MFVGIAGGSTVVGCIRHRSRHDPCATLAQTKAVPRDVDRLKRQACPRPRVKPGDNPDLGRAEITAVTGPFTRLCDTTGNSPPTGETRASTTDLTKSN